MDGMNRNPNDPNKGLNTRTYMISIVVALVIIFVGSLLFIKSRQDTMMKGIAHPKPTSANTPE
jgi:hypothetical protein